MTELPSAADVVIVGGGVIGLSAAYHLAAAGTGVVVVERDALGSGSTSKAAGGIRTAFSDDVNIQLAARSLAAFKRFEDEHDQAIDLHEPGYLFLLSTPEQLVDFTEASAMQQRHGIESQMISVDEAVGLSPIVDPAGLVGAMWSPDDGHCSPESVVQGYARSARRAGATIVTNCAVESVDVRHGQVVGVRTRNGSIATNAVVCAAGAWSKPLAATAGLDLPVEPLRRHIATSARYEAPPGLPFTIDFTTSAYVHREGDGLLVGAPDAIDVTASEPSRDDAWLEHLAELLHARFPALDDVGFRIAWSGLYEMTPDHNALIDRSAEVEGFVYATGFSGHGFLMGPAVGEVVRDLVRGDRPVVDVSALSVDRFATGTRIERHVV